jgi:hypothetical protein
MPAGNYDYTGDQSVEQGETWRKTQVFKDSTGALYDLTGFKAVMAAKRSYNAVDQIVNLTTENGGIVLGGPNGTIDLLLTAAQTKVIYIYQGIYQLDLISPGGDIIRFLEGYLDVKQGLIP